MSSNAGAYDYIQMLQKKAPAYLELLTAQTDDEFEKAFCTLLDQAVLMMESNKGNFERLNEEGLSAALAMALSVPGLTVDQEKHANGHVDITIEADHCTPTRRKLAEAKIYNGPAYHKNGLEQLLGRYTGGRELRGLLISYCRSKDIAGKVKALRSDMDLKLPCAQVGPTSDHTLKWSFCSEHHHSCGDVLGVDHIGINLCTG